MLFHQTSVFSICLLWWSSLGVFYKMMTFPSHITAFVCNRLLDPDLTVTLLPGRWQDEARSTVTEKRAFGVLAVTSDADLLVLALVNIWKGTERVSSVIQVTRNQRDCANRAQQLQPEPSFLAFGCKIFISTRIFATRCTLSGKAAPKHSRVF